MNAITQPTWQTVCTIEDLVADSGIALWFQEQAVAVFYLSQEQRLYAVGHYCPFAKANIIAHGIVGDLQGQPVVASPMYKEHFNLETGVCLEDPTIALPTFSIRRVGDQIELALTAQSQVA